jgi:hypothetical protein
VNAIVDSTANAGSRSPRRAENCGHHAVVKTSMSRKCSFLTRLKRGGPVKLENLIAGTTDGSRCPARQLRLSIATGLRIPGARMKAGLYISTCARGQVSAVVVI